MSSEPSASFLEILQFLGGSALLLAIAGFLAKRWLEQLLDRDRQRFTSELTLQLEGVRQQLSLDRERYSRDYGLFAERRNQVYADTYVAFEKARGTFSGQFAKLVITRNFAGAAEVDLRHMAESLTRLAPNERRRLYELLDTPGMLHPAGELATRLFEKDWLRRAIDDHREFRNFSVTNSLYYSRDIETLIAKARDAFSILVISAEDRIAEEEPREYMVPAAAVERLADLAERMRSTMRAEMQAGFTPTPPAPETRHP